MKDISILFFPLYFCIQLLDMLFERKDLLLAEAAVFRLLHGLTHGRFPLLR